MPNYDTVQRVKNPVSGRLVHKGGPTHEKQHKAGNMKFNGSATKQGKKVAKKK